MRSFALFTLTVALGSAACNDQESINASATDSTTTGSIEPEGTTAAPGTTTTSSIPDEPATTTGSTTELLPPTTGEPATTTGEPATTTGDVATSTTTTGEPETTGETEGVVKPSGAYEKCDNAMGIECQGSAICVDGANTNGQVQGSYCAPTCSGGPMNCPKPMDAGPNTHAVCAFDTNMDMDADICALICNLGADDCGNGSACEDIGIPDMPDPNDPMGIVQLGVCTYAN